jgi:segregation and condensation protein B
MAIVAYKQPVTKLEIDEIRGVSSDYGVSILLQNNLIEVVGRKDALGKPLLYGTTDAFLKRFELADINNLPSYEELMNKLKTVTAEVDLYGQS